VNGPPNAKETAPCGGGALQRAKSHAGEAWAAKQPEAKPERYKLSTFPPISAIKRWGRWVYVLRAP
jgi:hypothetical protein